MAIDFVHTAEVVEAVIAVLKGEGASHTGGLPTAWFTAGNDEELQTLEHGDWADYAKASNMDFTDDLPCILVRGMGPAPTGDGSISGVLRTEEQVRVLHIRKFEQCYNAGGASETNMAEARERYAKVIGAALFHDPHRKLAVIAAGGARTEVSLTSEDSNAQVYDVLWGGWDMGLDEGAVGSMSEVARIRSLPEALWAIGCDLRVRIRTGGQT